MTNDFIPADFIHAVQHYEWAVTEYRHQLETGVKPSDLKRVHTSVLKPALAECERRTARVNQEMRGLVEQLRQIQDEGQAAFSTLWNATNSMLADEEYRKLAENTEALAERCHAVQLLLRKYRKE